MKQYSSFSLSTKNIFQDQQLILNAQIVLNPTYTIFFLYHLTKLNLLIRHSKRLIKTKYKCYNSKLQCKLWITWIFISGIFSFIIFDLYLATSNWLHDMWNHRLLGHPSNLCVFLRHFSPFPFRPRSSVNWTVW